jgi:uncharacterized protein (TIGR00266 family)
MKTTLEGNPSFSHVHIDLNPGESITAESGAMQSMSAELDMKAGTNGGFFPALVKRFFGGESFFVSTFSNNGSGVRRVTIARSLPGEIRELRMTGDRELCLQKGAWLASSGNVRFRTAWAGFASWFSREGLVKLKASGEGTLWFGGYGGIVERKVEGELKVDDGHLIAYDPGLKLKVGTAGGLFSSMMGGEGFVTRVQGRGTVYIQTRSIKGLASWLNPRFR